MNKKDYSEVEIVEVSVEGAKLLSDIHEISFVKNLETGWTESDFKELFIIPGTYAYVIKVKNQPVGFILLREVIDEAEIITFCILPKWCNNGYATLLLEWVITKLQKQSFKRLFLEVRDNNKAAIRLYEKCSFKEIGRRKGYYQDHLNNRTDAIVMQHAFEGYDEKQ